MIHNIIESVESNQNRINILYNSMVLVSLIHKSSSIYHRLNYHDPEYGLSSSGLVYLLNDYVTRYPTTGINDSQPSPDIMINNMEFI